MAKKKAKSKSAPRKHATHERPLKNRPPDPPEPPENSETQEAAGDGDEEETKAKKPRQARLPGTEDPAIESLEALAESYAEARDERMRIGEREVDLKTQLLDEMRKNDKVKYFHSGVLIEVINSKDKVRVRIKKDE